VDSFFERVETGDNPWPAGRRDLHWHLLPPDIEAACKLLQDPYSELIHYPGLVLVPPQRLHVTVLHCGPQSEASDQEVADITARVREAVAGIGPLELTFARPTIGNVAVERTARPGAPARRLWEAVWNATTQVVSEERWPLRAETYYPHMSIAYAGPDARHVDRGGLKQLLSDIEGGEATLTFPSLTLVSQWHNDRHILWKRIATVPLERSTGR
jgi:2'-5' RNA ligase